MIGYLIIYKIKFYIKGLKNPWKILLSLILVLTAWMYGKLFGEISNKLVSGEIDFITVEKFTSIIIIAISVFTIIRMIFPNYNPLVQLFPKYYPLSKAELYFTSLINDFYKPYFFYLILFIISGSYYAENLGINFIGCGLLALVSSQLVRRSFHYMADFEMQISFRFFHIIGVLAIAYYVFALFASSTYIVLQLISIVIVLLLIGYFQESSIISRRIGEIKSKASKTNINIKLLLNNKKVRLPLIIGLLLKVFILFGDFFLLRIKGKHLFEGQIVFWLFASPLIIFTYVFNNVWGFWKNIWLNMELKVGDYKPMTLQVFRLVLIPLIIDLFITVPVLLFSWNNYEFILLFYFTITAYLLMLSFLWSLITPRKISSSFQMKGSTSPWSVIPSMAGVFLLTTIKINHWFYILIPVFLIIGGIGYWISIDLYREKKYIIANKLMKK